MRRATLLHLTLASLLLPSMACEGCDGVVDPVPEDPAPVDASPPSISVNLLPDEGLPVEVAWVRLAEVEVDRYRIERSLGSVDGPFEVLGEVLGDAPGAARYEGGMLTFEDDELLEDVLLVYQVVAEVAAEELASEVETIVRLSEPVLPRFQGQPALIGGLLLALEGGLPFASAAERFRVTRGVRVTATPGARDEVLETLSGLEVTVHDPGGELPIGVELTEAGFAEGLRVLDALDGVSDLWLDRLPMAEPAMTWSPTVSCAAVVHLIGADTWDFVDPDTDVRLFQIDTGAHMDQVGRTLDCILTANGSSSFTEDPVTQREVAGLGLYNAFVTARLSQADVVNVSLSYWIDSRPLPGEVFEGLLPVFAAGNRNLKTWDGPFVAKALEDGSIAHAFDGVGSSTWASLTVNPIGGDLDTYVSWDDPDVELGLRLRDVFGEVVASTSTAPGDACIGREQLTCLEVRKKGWILADLEVFVTWGEAEALDGLHLVVGTAAEDLTPKTMRFGINTHNALPEVLTVGGTKLPNGGLEVVQDYSSTGPGMPEHLSATTAKPDLVAPALLNGAGTSNAAPIVSAVAALIWAGIEDGTGFLGADPVSVVRERVLQATEGVDLACTACTGTYAETYGMGRIDLPEMVPVVGFAVADVSGADGATMADVPSEFEIMKDTWTSVCDPPSPLCAGVGSPAVPEPYRQVLTSADPRPMVFHAFTWFEPRAARSGAPVAFEHDGIAYVDDGVVQVPKALMDTLVMEPVERWLRVGYFETGACDVSPWMIDSDEDHCWTLPTEALGAFPADWTKVEYADLIGFRSVHRAIVPDSVLGAPDAEMLGPIWHRTTSIPLIDPVVFSTPRLHQKASECWEPDDLEPQPTYPRAMDAALVVPEDGGIDALELGVCPGSELEGGGVAAPARFRGVRVARESVPEDEGICYCFGGGKVYPCGTAMCQHPCAADCPPLP